VERNLSTAREVTHRRAAKIMANLANEIGSRIGAAARLFSHEGAVLTFNSSLAARWDDCSAARARAWWGFIITRLRLRDGEPIVDPIWVGHSDGTIRTPEGWTPAVWLTNRIAHHRTPW